MNVMIVSLARCCGSVFTARNGCCCRILAAYQGFLQGWAPGPRHYSWR